MAVLALKGGYERDGDVALVGAGQHGWVLFSARSPAHLYNQLTHRHASAPVCARLVRWKNFTQPCWRSLRPVRPLR